VPECGGCTEAEILAAVGRTRLLFEPFTSTAYSNLGSALLGRALEKVANMSWEEWVTRRILAPLNMTRSGGGAVCMCISHDALPCLARCDALFLSYVYTAPLCVMLTQCGRCALQASHMTMACERSWWKESIP
jgi:hypothetical protein